MPTNDIRDLNRRTVEASVTLASRVTPADLDRPTPCSEWTLGDLLSHMTAQHRGFAAAARGTGEDLATWEMPALGSDPAAVYAASAADVLAAFAEEGVLERKFALPELGKGIAFPATQAIGFHFIDYVVHAWDVARSLNIPFEEPDAEVLEAALTIAREVPDGPYRLQPGTPFAPSIPIPANATPLEEILLLLGRSPHE